jgi:hypothetical protein
MSEELMAAADRIAELQAEVHRLNQERQGNCLAGQSMMEEAYGWIESLNAEIASLKDGEEYRLMQDRIQRLVDGGNKLREDKRELVEACQAIIIYQENYHGATKDYFPGNELWSKLGMDVVEKVKAAVSKHKEAV